MRLDKKDSTTNYRRIDSRHMQRSGIFSDGNAGSWGWQSPDGQLASRIDYSVENNCLWVFHRDAWRSHNYPIQLERTPCHYGNERVWFNCPYCSARVAILYLSERFACRTCCQLNYPSQQDAHSLQDRRRMNSIKHKLGWHVAENWRTKPKGMHWVTYEHLEKQYYHYELQHVKQVSAKIDKLC